MKCGAIRTSFLSLWWLTMWKQEIMDTKERFADAFMLPKDVVMNATLFHMVGASDVYLENFKGILSYTCHEIIVKGHDCKLCICGNCLTIAYYSNEDMKISGQIEEVKISR